MKSFKEFILDEDCWKGYTQKGMKKKGDKDVPNCVKESTDLTESDNIKVTDSTGKNHLFYSTPTTRGKAFYLDKNTGTTKPKTLFLGNDRNVALQRFEHITQVPLSAEQRYIDEAQEYLGVGSTTPTVPANFDGTQPFIPGTSAPFQIEHEGKNWFHGGRVSVNPFSGQRMYQYVQEKEVPGDEDVGPNKTVWADISGSVMGCNYPNQTTAAQGSIQAGEGASE